MIDEVQKLLQEYQEVHLSFLALVSTVTDEELSAETGDQHDPTVRHWIDRVHWHFGTHLRQIIQTRKNLEPKYYPRRALHLPELAGFIGPLAGELVTVTPEVFEQKPGPEKMSIKENLEHLIRTEREYLIPRLTQALSRVRSS